VRVRAYVIPTEGGEELRIAVCDTGHGIARENLARLFTQ
jgi:signal transduction histidine kinase